MTLLAFHSTYKVRTHEHDCQNGHIFGFVTFLIFLHNVTLFVWTIPKSVTFCKNLKKVTDPNIQGSSACKKSTSTNSTCKIFQKDPYSFGLHKNISLANSNIHYRSKVSDQWV